MACAIEVHSLWIFSNLILKTGKICLDFLECRYFPLPHDDVPDCAIRMVLIIVRIITQVFATFNIKIGDRKSSRF